MWRKALIAVVFIAVVGLLVWANLRKAGGQTAAGNAGPKNAVTVKGLTVEPRDLIQTVSAPGTLEAAESREVRAAFASPRVHLLAGLGDQVTEGQVIAELESDDLRVQVAAQEAAAARAEAALAQLYQQKQLSPLQLDQKLESARSQLAAAQQALDAAQKQPAAAQQRVDQAKSGLLTVQNRAGRAGDDVALARQKLADAEAAYRASPLNAAARKAYDDATQAYQAALRRSTEDARQAAADLTQAGEALQTAQQDLDAASSGDTAAAAQAKAQLESARLALEMAKREAEAGGTQAEQIRAAEADLASARAALEVGRTKLAQASLKAPVGGTVLSVGLKDGQPVNPGQLLFEIGRLDRLTLRARVDEVDVGKVKTGQALSLKSNAFQGERFTGKVVRVAAQSSAPDPRSGLGTGTFYEVQGEIPNPDGRLKSGMSAEARITTETRSNAVVVGLEALREDGNNAWVLVIKDYQVAARPVRLGLRTQTEVEILDGLTPGEQIMAGPFTLIKSIKDNTPVKVEAVKPPERGDEQ